MGLFGKGRQSLVKAMPLPESPLKHASKSVSTFHGTLAERLTSEVLEDLVIAHRELAEAGYAEDVEVLNEAVRTYYSIAVKLQQFDEVLDKAASQDIHGLFHHWGSLETVDETDNLLRARLDKWSESTGLELFKRRVEQRNQIADGLIESTRELHRTRREIRMALVAPEVGSLLPDFTAIDAAANLLDIERVTARARAVSETISEIEAPTLESLTSALEEGASPFEVTPSPAITQNIEN
jgi:hypothetical protein